MVREYCEHMKKIFRKYHSFYGEDGTLFIKDRKKSIFFYYGITGRVFFIPKRQFPHSVALRTLSESPGPSVEAVPI